MPVSTKTPSSSKSKSKPTAKAPSKAPAKATAAKAKTAVKASVKSVAPQEVVEAKAASKKATAAATATATKAASKAKTKVSEPAKVESKPADKTKAKAKPSKSAVKSVEPQEVVEVKAKSKKAPAKATASKATKATKADSKAKASEPAKVESKPTDKVKAKAKSAAKASVKSAEPQEVVEVKAPSKKAPAKVATATKAAAKKAATKVVAKAKVESKSTANAKGVAKASVKSVEPQEVVEVKAKSKKAPAKASATKVVSKTKSSEPAKAASKAGAKTKAKVVAKGYEVYAEPSEGVEAEFKDITLLNKEERYELMRLLQEQNPNPKSELEFKNTFELLCAVVLSAQATDASVNKATPALFNAAPDPKSMAKLGAEGIAPYIQSIGLWKNKAKFLAQLSQALLDKHDGKVPGSFDELVALPGVGSKTAKVVLNVAFGQPFIAVDTHVYRVATRTGLCLGKCPGQVEERISPLVAEPFLKEAHHYLLLHGRYNCTAQRFEGHCDKCVVAKYCKHNYERKEK